MSVATVKNKLLEPLFFGHNGLRCEVPLSRRAHVDYRTRYDNPIIITHRIIILASMRQWIVFPILFGAAYRHTPSREEMLQLRSASRAPGTSNVPADFECAWRSFAYDFANELQPQRPASFSIDVFDALQLAQCMAGARRPA